MLRELRIENFKAFQAFTLTSNGDTYLVGPNNAGKSTLVAAARSCARMLRLAMAREPGRARVDRGIHFRSYALDGGRLGLVEENLRHEFRALDTRLRVKFDGGASITAVWPAPVEHEEEYENDSEAFTEDAEQGAFFYLELDGRRQPLRPGEVRKNFPNLAVIPVLTPVEQKENVR